MDRIYIIITEIPNEFVYPITLVLMGRHVKSSHKALKITPLSPTTKNPIQTNYVLKIVIEKFLNKGENPLKKIKQLQTLETNSKTKIKSFKAEVIDGPKNIGTRKAKIKKTFNFNFKD